MTQPTRSNKELTIIIFGSSTGFVIGVFSVIRLLNEHYNVALFDGIISLASISLSLYVWRTSKTYMTGIFLSIIFLVGALSMIYVFGTKQVYWAFPAFMVPFFITPAKIAIPLSLISYFAILFPMWQALPVTDFLRIMLSLAAALILSSTVLRMNHRKTKELTALANIDVLTSVGNRRALNTALLKSIENKYNYESLCLFIIDLDYFKRINDIYGHLEGDRILTCVAKTISEQLNQNGKLYRYGGEEFVVLINTDKNLANHVAENIRKAVSSANIIKSETLSVSIGIAVLEDSDNPLSLLERADEGLLQAKSRGRNQVVINL